MLRADDAGNTRTWRDTTIGALANACDAVPAGVRVAAERAHGATVASERARILAAAATASLGAQCGIPDPLADARQLAKACPLPAGLRFRLDESVLMDLRAVDYALMLVVLRSFKQAGEYNEAAERVVLNFSLSAQIFGEDLRRQSSPTLGR